MPPEGRPSAPDVTHYLNQCATGNPVPVPANPATFKEIRFRAGPAKYLNIDRIQTDFDKFWTIFLIKMILSLSRKRCF